MPRVRSDYRNGALDELDFRILRRLQADGRESNAEIARALEVSEGTVRRRIRRLLEEDVMRVTAVPDPVKVGFDAVALIGLRVELGRIDEVASKLGKMKEVHFLAFTTGSYDLFIWIMVPSPEDLGVFIKDRLGATPGVIRSETFVNLETRKRTFGWLS